MAARVAKKDDPAEIDWLKWDEADWNDFWANETLWTQWTLDDWTDFFNIYSRFNEKDWKDWEDYCDSDGVDPLTDEYCVGGFEYLTQEFGDAASFMQISAANRKNSGHNYQAAMIGSASGLAIFAVGYYACSAAKKRAHDDDGFTSVNTPLI